MGITYYGYPKCGSCKKAVKWFQLNDVDFKEVDITQNPPTANELTELITTSGVDIKKFFNVSGMKYRELNLKDKLPTMSDQEKVQLLATDGMLIKRPLVFGNGKLTLGFKEDEFEKTWLN